MAKRPCLAHGTSSGALWKANAHWNVFTEIESVLLLSETARTHLDQMWRHMDVDLSGTFTLNDLTEAGFTEETAQVAWDFIRCQMGTDDFTPGQAVSGKRFIASLRRSAMNEKPSIPLISTFENHGTYAQAVVDSMNHCLVYSTIAGWTAKILPTLSGKLVDSMVDDKFWKTVDTTQGHLPEMTAGLYLYEKTKVEIEALFNLLDADGSKTITVNDFIVHGMSPERAAAKWSLMAPIDRNGDHSIDVNEFVEGLKYHAIRAGPIQSYFTAAPVHHVQCFSWLNASLNTTIQKMLVTIMEDLKKD